MKNPFTAEARRLAGLRLQEEYAKHSRGAADSDGDHYNENQPRVPAGQPGGGQWTSGGGAGGVRADEQEAPAHVGRSPLVDLLKEQAVDVPPDERVQQAFLPAVIPPALGFAGGIGIRFGIQRAITSALAAYAAMTAQNDRNKQAVFTFQAREFTGNPATGEIDKAASRVLSREEVGKFCKLKLVQDETDQAVKDVNKNGRHYASAALYGTAVHSRLEGIINGSYSHVFWTEKSFLKGVEESDDKSLRGVLGTIRIDVLQRLNENTVCVFDIKTGKSGLSLPRMKEIAWNVYKSQSGVGAQRIIVVETRPSHRYGQ